MEKRICVIGGGLAGITAVKSLVEEGLSPTCYENRKDLGGVWNYNKDEKLNRGRVYDCLIANVSKEVNSFSDFPMPQEFPPFLNVDQFQSYLKSYVQHFKLENYFHLGKKVVSVVEQDVKLGEQRRWRVTVEDVATGEILTEGYDSVLICSGEFGKPNCAKYEGLNKSEFEGRIINACEYNSADEFEGKNVLVIGLGSSGGDIGVDVSRKAKKTFISTRNGAYVIPRIYQNGLPYDLMITPRISATLQRILPTWVNEWIAKKFIYNMYDYKLLGIQSRYSGTNPVASLLVSDELAPKIFSGKIHIKPDVTKATANRVHFKDGTRETIDVVIVAAGYSPSFPFISDTILPDRTCDMKLFEWMIPFEITDPSSLAVIGLLPFAPLARIPRYECQTRYMAQVIAGITTLPSKDEMRKAFQKERANFTQYARFGHPFLFRGNVGLGITYSDRIATLGGFYPSFWSLFFKDPKLALALHLGPYMAHHYRIVGRHSNKDFAREKTLDVVKNTLSGVPQLVL